jgi:hypothetical protein
VHCRRAGFPGPQTRSGKLDEGSAFLEIRRCKPSVPVSLSAGLSSLLERYQLLQRCIKEDAGPAEPFAGTASGLLLPKQSSGSNAILCFVAELLGVFGYVRRTNRKVTASEETNVALCNGLTRETGKAIAGMFESRSANPAFVLARW